MSVLLVLAALTSVMADGFGLPISLSKKPKPIDPVSGTSPLSATEEDEVCLSLESLLSDGAIFLSASYATFARISVVYESGTVVYDQMDIFGNEPAEIATLGWPLLTHRKLF